MRRLLFVLVVMVWAVPFAVSAKTYKSDFGFTLDLPSGWVVVSRENVKDKPDIVEGALKTAEKGGKLSSLPKDVWNNVKEALAGGKVEYYYSPDPPRFNISVHEGQGEIPRNAAKVKEICGRFPEALSKISGRPIGVYECELKKVSGRNALYLVADYKEGEKYIQYQIQKSPDRILLFTANSQGKAFDQMRAEFEEVIKTLRLG